MTAITALATENGGMYPAYGFGYGGYGRDGCVEELVTANQIANGIQDILTADHQGTAAVISALQTQGLSITDTVNNNGRDNQTAIHQTSAETRLGIANTASETRDRINSTATTILMGQKDILRDLLVSAGKTQLHISEAKSDIQLEACKNTGAIQLEAQKNRNDILAQLAECCCEIKELVRAENGATRELIQSNLLDAERAKNTAASQEILLLKLGIGIGGNGNGNSLK